MAVCNAFFNNFIWAFADGIAGLFKKHININSVFIALVCRIATRNNAYDRLRVGKIDIIPGDPFDSTPPVLGACWNIIDRIISYS